MKNVSNLVCVFLLGLIVFMFIHILYLHSMYKEHIIELSRNYSTMLEFRNQQYINLRDSKN